MSRRRHQRGPAGVPGNDEDPPAPNADGPHRVRGCAATGSGLPSPRIAAAAAEPATCAPSVIHHTRPTEGLPKLTAKPTHANPTTASAPRNRERTSADVLPALATPD